MKKSEDIAGRILPFFSVLAILLAGFACLAGAAAGGRPSGWAEDMAAFGRGLTADSFQGQPPGASLAPEPKKGEAGSYNAPDWLKRTSVGAAIESRQKPRYYLETVQPLYRSKGKMDTFFTHLRASGQDGYGTYSAGLGYRRLMFDKNLMVGVNTFFDFQDPNQHYRQGAGLEFIGKYAELRWNGYFALSPARVVEENGSTMTMARAVNGCDVEFGVPVPYLPWLKIFGGYYWYDFRESSDMQGWKGRTEVKALSFMTANLETFSDNKGSQDWRADIRMTLWVDSFAPKDVLAALASSFRAPLPEADLRERILDRVERNFTIQLETYHETGAGGDGMLTVEIGRN
ncbi:MAG TPA: inverse autotransporter beta domain-containing protein [Syntrophales bacterium]|nr:inverse autotransporter beta domain-containing protein [Syntrophales bacterium]